jgi:hypothetical protein
MSSQGTKRARTEEPAVEGEAAGRAQLLITSPELQTRLGQKHCDETELLALLLAHGVVRRVRTVEVEVRPLGGDSFNVKLDTSKPTVGEAKSEIARVQGTKESRQELYKVAESADGKPVREDDAEPELLDDEGKTLKDGAVVAMAVKDEEHVWLVFAVEDKGPSPNCDFACSSHEATLVGVYSTQDAADATANSTLAQEEPDSEDEWMDHVDSEEKQEKSFSVKVVKTKMDCSGRFFGDLWTWSADTSIGRDY